MRAAEAVPPIFAIGNWLVFADAGEAPSPLLLLCAAFIAQAPRLCVLRLHRVAHVLDEEGEVLRVRVFVLRAGGQLLEHVGPAEAVGHQPLGGESPGREARVAPSGGLGLGLHIEQQAEDADRGGGSHFSADNAARPFLPHGVGARSLRLAPSGG